MESQEFQKSIEEFKVIFGGENKIDVELFTKTIDDTVSLIKETANIVDPNCFIRLEIKANKEGSFESIIDVVTKYAPDLLVTSSVASNIIQGVLNFILIKKHLKGRKSKKTEINNDEMAIQNQDNEVIKVDKVIGTAYLKNSTIDRLIVNITNNLVNSDRDNLKIEAKNSNVTIDKSEYIGMSTSVVDNNPIVETITQKPIDVELLLKKPDLLGNSKWGFIYYKNIEASIQDEEFLEKVRKGYIRSLYAGVKIPCTLLCEYDLDDNHNVIPNSDRYIILKVTGDIIEPDENKQFSLFGKNVEE